MASTSISLSDRLFVRLLLATAFSLFFFSETTRSIFNQSTFNLSLNFLFFCIGILTIGVFLLKEFVDLRIVLITIVFAGVSIISLVAAGNSMSQLLKLTVSMFLPFLLTGFRLTGSVFESFLAKFIKTFNVVCIILVGVGICDYLSGAAIQIYCAQHSIFDSDFTNLILLERTYGVYRYYSFVGFPLTTAWYILVFYALNILYNRYYTNMLNEYLVTLITMIGLVLCGSRTALIIGLFMLVFLNNMKNKAVFLTLLSAASAGLASTPLFQENLLKRFIIHSDNYSEGRNEALSRVINSYVTQPSIFPGGGMSYSRQVTLSMGGVINSFEYPLMMFAYDWGILGALLIYLLILLIPALICVRNKSYFILMSFLAISLYMNGHNDMANYSDYLGQFCFLVMIIVNMSYLVKDKKVKSEAV